MSTPQKIKPELIELVRINECIYNPKHKHYKNKGIKYLKWEEIGAKLNIGGTRARETWRTLRDGYIRYKKAVKLGKKPSMYSWSDQLTFLDEVIDSKEKGTENFPQVFFSEELYSKIDTDSPEHQGTEGWMDSANSPVPSFNTQSLPGYSNHQSAQTSRKRKSETMDKVLEYFKNKKRKEHDAVDLLFMSYAKTFKNLPARKQAKLKVTLAKVFAEAEFGELDTEEVND